MKKNFFFIIFFLLFIKIFSIHKFSNKKISIIQKNNINNNQKTNNIIKKLQNFIFSSYGKLNFIQKTSTTPLYFLSNSNGQSYIQDDRQSGFPNQRAIFYFMSSEDANYHLEEMSQANNQNVNEFRLSVTSLEKVLNQIKNKKQSSKIGRQGIDIVNKIVPSSRQISNASKLIGSKKIKDISIPSFTIPGLEIKRGNGEVISPYYLSYEDLLSDWKENINKKNPPKEVKVYDLIQLSSTNIENNRKKNKILDFFSLPPLPLPLGIVPPKKEIELLRNYYRDRTFIRGEYVQATGTSFK